MTTRYFKATNGTVTVFRASKTKVYTHGAQIDLWNVAFATAAKPGLWPAEEITKGEYDTLQARKVERVRSSGHPIAWASSPYNSWVNNAALEG